MVFIDGRELSYSGSSPIPKLSILLVYRHNRNKEIYFCYVCWGLDYLLSAKDFPDSVVRQPVRSGEGGKDA
jgi:hypothetical protein